MLRICLVAPANTQAKTWQRVCLPQCTKDSLVLKQSEVLRLKFCAPKSARTPSRKLLAATVNDLDAFLRTETLKFRTN